MAFSLMVGTVSCLLSIIWGGPFVEVVRRLGLGKNVRSSMVSRDEKQGTPTFGGVLMILVALLVTTTINLVNFLRGRPEGRSILLPMVALIAFGALGAVDDWEGIVSSRGQKLGLSEKVKLGAQIALAFAVALILFFPFDTHNLALPGIPFFIDLGIFYIPVAAFIVIGSANAVNFTDGLDGLAGNIAMIAFGSYGIIASLQGQTWLSAFCFVMVGCLLGFLWFNAKPALIYMGDTGSQAIGAALAIVALMSGHWLLLPIIGSVFVIEALSVIAQRVGFFYGKVMYGDKERGRIFRMAPIHHHFERLQWGEVQIVYRFFFIGLLSGMLGIALALL